MEELQGYLAEPAAGPEVRRCSLTPDVYGYRVRCIRLQCQIRTDVGSYLS